MTRELPSIGLPLDFVQPVNPAIVTLIETSIGNVITVIGEHIEGGVALGGVVSFAETHTNIPFVTAVPEVL